LTAPRRFELIEHGTLLTDMNCEPFPDFLLHGTMAPSSERLERSETFAGTLRMVRVGMALFKCQHNAGIGFALVSQFGA